MKKIMFLFLILFSLILNVNAQTGTILIKRYDNDKKERLEATFVGSQVNVYKNNGLIAILTVDENGEAVLEGLELGMYTVSEREGMIGYKTSLYTHTVYITGSENVKLVSWGSSVIEGNLIINKYYGEEENYKLDNEAVFEVYHNNNLIKTLTPINGVISEKLEYGTYTIKQVGGTKYYDYTEEFVVKIEEEKDYKYDLYTEVEEDVKGFIEEKQDELKIKEEELIKIEKELEEKRINLLNVQTELIKKEQELEEERNLINLEKELLQGLNTEIEEKNKELLIQKEELEKLKNTLELVQNTLNLKEEELKMLELKIKLKEDDVKKIENELNILNSKLLKKETILKENELNTLDNQKKDVLVVNVPDTKKINYNKLVSIILIILGIIILILRKRKVTNH